MQCTEYLYMYGIMVRVDLYNMYIEMYSSLCHVYSRLSILLATSSGCFCDGDRVDAIDGGTRRIEDLQVDDAVRLLSVDGQPWIEDEIVMMMHNGFNKTIQSCFHFQLISIESKRWMEMRLV